MPIENKVASVANLARGWLLSLDMTQLETSVPTASLELMLTTLVELATPSHDEKIGEAAARSVLATASRFGE